MSNQDRGPISNETPGRYIYIGIVSVPTDYSFYNDRLPVYRYLTNRRKQ